MDDGRIMVDYTKFHSTILDTDFTTANKSADTSEAHEDE